MRQFIILTTILGNDVAIDINDITSINRTENRNGDTYTTVNYGGGDALWNVKESVTEIVKRINTINNKM